MTGTKRCRVCGLDKPLSEFYLDRGVPAYRCKRCLIQRDAELRAANRERYQATKRLWVEKNREKMRAACRKCYHKNKDRYKPKKLAYSKAYQKRHPDRVCAIQNARERAKARAVPAWANKEAIKDAYAKARRVSQETGITHHVDHIVPIKSRLVCGLHVEHNLQVIPSAENHAKFNTHWPDMP